MSNEQPSTQPTMREGFWTKGVDPYIKQIALVLGIIYVVYNIITHIILPIHEFFTILPSLALAGWYFYSWRKNKYFVFAWWFQHVVLFQVAACIASAVLELVKGTSGYHIFISILWFLTGAAWIGLSLLAARELSNYYHNNILELWQENLKDAKQMKEVMESMRSMNENISLITKNFGLMIEIDASRMKTAELAETAKRLEAEQASRPELPAPPDQA